MSAPAVLNKWDIFLDPLVNWDPHPGQELVVCSEARFRALAAGRRFGKSDIGGHELIPEAFLTYQQRYALEEAGKRREFWIVGPEYSDSEKEFRVIWNACKKLGFDFDRPGCYYNAESGSMHLSLFGGRFIVSARSAKYPDTLVGEGLSGVILAEAAKLKERVWDKYILPTLADFKGWALLTSTPEGKNWFYEKWQMGQNPGIPDWDSWRMAAWVNHFVYRTPTNEEHVVEALEILKNFDHPTQAQLEKMFTIDEEVLMHLFNMSEEMFNQEIFAKFTEFVGLVFKAFDEEFHVTDLELQPGWRTFGAVDYGFTNPNVWLLCQEGPWGEVNVIDEVYQSGLTAPEFADLIQRRGLCPGNTTTFYPDPASPGDTRQLEQILRVPHTGGTGGERKDRIDAIRKALKRRHPHLGWDHPEQRATVMFSRRCTNTIRDFLSYRYPDSRGGRNNPEEPLDKDNHGPEALGRYFKATGTPAEEAKSTRVSTANVRG